MPEGSPPSVNRWAACVALVAFAAAAVALALAATANLGGLLVILAGVVITILGAWHLATGRGTARVFAGVVVAAGVALLVMGIVWLDLHALRWVVALCLIGLSVGAARLALGKHAHRAASPAARTAAGPAKRPVLILNLKSGGGKAERFHLVEECQRRGIEPIVLTPGDDLLVLAENAVAQGADIIGMAGGDGSQALVASVAVQHNVPYVVVPAGTRNHFALDLGLDRDDVVGALDAFSDGFEIAVDLATVNGRIFVNNATLGLYAKIVQSAEYRDAKLRTTLDMLPDLLGPDARGLDLRFTGPDGVMRTTTDVLLISNNPYELHRFAGRGTRARLDQGVLGIASATIDNANAAATFVSLEFAGQAQRFPGWLEWTSHRFEVDTADKIEIGVDGEALQMNPPLIFESLPAALRVRLPSRASGGSPAARALHLASQSTLAELMRVATGSSREDS
jgi:diacylglycerol kinase family enzyme